MYVPDTNKQAYESEAVVGFYSDYTRLQKPEETILNILRPGLGNMNMLDIGVGAGRTTIHFAMLVKGYVGIDYSQGMIDACLRNFPEAASKGFSFKVCDARSLTDFEDGSFDFVLFSFNGIDLMSHEDRLRTLREIKRLCSKEGRFCFSTHNLQTLRTIHLCKNPIVLVRRISKYFAFRNTPLQTKWAIIPGGESGHELAVYYVRPRHQIGQLRDLGFGDIRIFGLTDGKEITGESELDARGDDWLYYLCSVE